MKVTELQWVHGRKTVVLLQFERKSINRLNASMGPRSENRGFDGYPCLVTIAIPKLQWVHGRKTVVLYRRGSGNRAIRHASMGPRSENRGFDGETYLLCRKWGASMGPRSENRGFGS